MSESVCRSIVHRIHTFVGVNLEVEQPEEKLSKEMQPRVDVSAAVRKRDQQNHEMTSQLRERNEPLD